MPTPSPVHLQLTWEEQQHREPSGEGRRGRVRPRIRRPLPYGGAECRFAARQTTTPLQYGGARLLTGGAPAQQGPKVRRPPTDFTHNSAQSGVIRARLALKVSTDLRKSDF